jgi:hypothetical protein
MRAGTYHLETRKTGKEQEKKTGKGHPLFIASRENQKRRKPEKEPS